MKLLIITVFSFIIAPFTLFGQVTVFYDNAFVSPAMPVNRILYYNDGKFKIRDEYSYSKKKHSKDSSLLTRQLYDSSGYISAIGWYDKNELIRTNAFFWSNDRLLEEQIETPNHKTVVNYHYDDNGNTIEERKMRFYGVDFQDSTFSLTQWEYDSANQPIKQTEVRKDGTSYTRKTFHYLNGKLFEEKVFDPKEGWMYSYLLTYEGERTINKYFKNSFGRRLESQWTFDSHKRLINQKSFNYSFEYASYHYDAESKLVEKIETDDRNRKSFYRYFYSY